MYISCTRRAANAKIIVLTNQLVCAKNALYLNRSSDSSLISDLESQLSSLVSREAEDAKVRSCAQWFRRVRNQHVISFTLKRSRPMSTLLIFLNDIVKTSQKDLENSLVLFYKDFFGKDSLDLQIHTEIIDNLEFSRFSAFWQSSPIVLSGFVPFPRNKFSGLFQDFSRTQIDFSKTLKFTSTFLLPRSQF